MVQALIVDDEIAVASIINHFIEKNNIPIEIVGTAENGKEAIEMIRAKKPQIVFLDIQMPLMNGFDVMKAVKDVIFIVITAYESFEYAQQALRLGASDIILKPIEYRQFEEAINRSLGWKFTANNTVNSILEYIHAHYREKIDLNQLSRNFYVTPSHISRLFKKYMNTSIVSYINKLRIEKAVELLTKENYSVKETADYIGYDSLNNFYKYFKQHTGVTPAAYYHQYVLNEEGKK